MNLPPLRVSADGRRLQFADSGQFFYYCADTAWTLFHRLTLNEARLYLRMRKRQGFNAYQVMGLIEQDGLTSPNANGHLPLEHADPAKPIEAYWQHVDQVIAIAEELGLYTALLPTWGDKWNKLWGVGPVIFNPQNTFAYGAWIADRYKHNAIIWVLGGDRPIQTEEHRLIVRRMAEGIRSVVGRNQLITYHPWGRHSSCAFVHEEPWLDFNMMQSGHNGYDVPNWSMIAADLARTPAKPTLDGEPCYDDHPVMETVDGQWLPTGDWFDAYDVRKTAFRSLLAGACGYTYGCHDTWQCYEPGVNKPINFARTPWRLALDLPGARQAAKITSFVARANQLSPLQPAQHLLQGKAFTPADQPVAAVAEDGSLALVYLPKKLELSIDLPLPKTVVDPVTLVPGESKPDQLWLFAADTRRHDLLGG